MAEWYENLTDSQKALYYGYIDSEVRLLGKSYGAAVKSVQDSERIRDEVLAITNG